MKRSVPATPFRVIGSGDQGDFTTSSESPETPATMNRQAASSSTAPSGSSSQLAPSSSCPATQSAIVAHGQSSQLATSSSGQVSAASRTGQRGRACPASGSGSRPSSGAPFHQFNVQHQHHRHLHQNTQHNTVNAIDPQQLEDMVNSLVAARVEASLQMQGRVKEAMNQLDVQHQERLAIVQEERNAQIQRVQAEAELMLKQARQEIEHEVDVEEGGRRPCSTDPTSS